MKHFQALFGQYSIVVPANSIEEARSKVLVKYRRYKDGSRKKEYIRQQINNEFCLVETTKHNGLWA